MPEPDDPRFTPLKEAQKIVISRSPQEPLALENSTLIAGDAVEVIPGLKEESPVDLRGHGSTSMNHALLAPAWSIGWR